MAGRDKWLRFSQRNETVSQEELDTKCVLTKFQVRLLTCNCSAYITRPKCVRHSPVFIRAAINVMEYFCHTLSVLTFTFSVLNSKKEVLFIVE